MENILEVPKKIKNRTTVWSSNSTPGYLAEENESTSSKRYIHPYPIITATFFTIAKTWKTPKGPSMDKWIKKLWCIYIMKYSATKMNDIYGPWGHRGKWNKSYREREILYDISYMWNLKDQKTNKTQNSYRYRE